MYYGGYIATINQTKVCSCCTITTTFTTTQVAKGLSLLAEWFVKTEDKFLWVLLYRKLWRLVKWKRRNIKQISNEIKLKAEKKKGIDIQQCQSFSKLLKTEEKAARQRTGGSTTYMILLTTTPFWHIKLCHLCSFLPLHGRNTFENNYIVTIIYTTVLTVVYQKSLMTTIRLCTTRMPFSDFTQRYT